MSIPRLAPHQRRVADAHDVSIEDRAAGDVLRWNGSIYVHEPLIAQLTYNLTAGAHNDLSLDTGYGHVRLNPIGAATITGIDATDADTRRVLVLTNVSGAADTITLAHESASSSAANRLDMGLDTDLDIEAGESVTLIYDSVTQRWRLLSRSADRPRAGTAFPTNPADWEEFRRTDLGDKFFYDPVRAKWLGDGLETYTFGAYVSSKTAEHMKVTGNVYNTTREGHALFGYDRTLVGISIRWRNSRTLYWRIHRGTVVLDNIHISTAAQYYSDNTYDIDFAEGTNDDVLSVYWDSASSTGITWPTMTILARRHAT